MSAYKSFCGRAGNRSNPQDVTLALGHADSMARIEQVERV